MEEEDETDYKKLDMPPPISGKHKFRFCQQLYLDIHAFMNQREWAATKEENEVSGITWIELFILFDTGSYRSVEGDHVKDEEAKKRAESRQSHRSSGEKKEGKKRQQDATTLPTFEQELSRFKGIVRNIARHELTESQAKTFSNGRKAKTKTPGDCGCQRAPASN